MMATDNRMHRYLSTPLCLAVWIAAANVGRIDARDSPPDKKTTSKSNEEEVRKASLLTVGQQAASFHLKTLDGKDFSLDRQRGKVVLLNFFATWCGPCRAELPHVQKIWEANHDRSDFVLLVVGREESDETVAKFKKKDRYTFPMAADPKRAAYSLYAKQFIPRTYLIDREGRICFASTGFRPEELRELKRQLAKQLGETKSE